MNLYAKLQQRAAAGQPVRIVDLAEQLIEWSGWTPHQDIKIVYTGLRPGERLHETLIAGGEYATPSHEAGVFQLETCAQFYAHVEPALISLAVALEQDDKDLALSAMQAMIERHEPIAIETIGGPPA